MKKEKKNPEIHMLILKYKLFFFFNLPTSRYI